MLLTAGVEGAAADIGDKDVLLSTLKLVKTSVDDIVRELDGTARPGFVIFHPFFVVTYGGQGPRNHVFYQVFTAATETLPHPNKIAGNFSLNPSPPAKFTD